jgi:hypothetical protein
MLITLRTTMLITLIVGQQTTQSGNYLEIKMEFVL